MQHLNLVIFGDKKKQTIFRLEIKTKKIFGFECIDHFFL